MGVSVIGNEMAARRDLADEVRAIAHEAAYEKEGSARPVRVEEIEQLRRNRRVRTIVKGNGELVGRGAAANRRAE